MLYKGNDSTCRKPYKIINVSIDNIYVHIHVPANFSVLSNCVDAVSDVYLVVQCSPNKSLIGFK